MMRIIIVQYNLANLKIKTHALKNERPAHTRDAMLASLFH